MGGAALGAADEFDRVSGLEGLAGRKRGRKVTSEAREERELP